MRQSRHMRDELSPSEAAARLGTTTRSIQRWIAVGRVPARRVGGRWRVASDALDAFTATGDASETLDQPPATAHPAGAHGATERRIRRLFVANRGEIARRIGRTADRLGVAVIEPATDGPAGLNLLDIRAVVAAARTAGADALH